MVNSKWECSPFGPPESPGVYAVVCMNINTGESTVLYIGSSKNISKRVLNPKHPYRMLFDVANYPSVICVKYKECPDFIGLERRLIKRLKPKYNLQHTGIEYRSYSIKL